MPVFFIVRKPPLKNKKEVLKAFYKYFRKPDFVFWVADTLFLHVFLWKKLFFKFNNQKR